MRIGDPVVLSIAASLSAGLAAGWLPGLVVLVVGTILTFVVNDIRKAGGVTPWAIKLVSAFDAWDEYRSRHAKRRGKREEEAIRRTQRFAKLERGRSRARRRREKERP